MSYIFNTIFTTLGQKRAHSEKTSLDTFNSMGQNIVTELDAWLTFFSCTDAEHIVRLVQKYPKFLEYYKDIAVFRTKPKELIYMFSEALEILDRNTANYMIDELAQEVKSVKEELDLAKSELDSAKSELDSAKSELDSAKSELDSAKKESMTKDTLIDTQKNELATKDEQLATKDAQLATKDEEIAKLKAQLEALEHDK